LLAGFTLRREDEGVSRTGEHPSPSHGWAAWVRWTPRGGVLASSVPESPPGTHRGAGQPGESSLASLSGEADDTALAGDTLGSGGAGSALGDKRPLRVVAAAGATPPTEGTAEGCGVAGGARCCPASPAPLRGSEVGG